MTPLFYTGSTAKWIMSDKPAQSDRPVRARRWSRAPSPSSSPVQRYRLAFRLIGIPAAAVAGVLIYRGLRDHFVLPACDSDRAKQTLSDVLKELKLEPTRYEPLTTVSSDKDQVTCSALLPLPDGASVAVDYKFYWQGSTASMRYSVSRRTAVSPPSP
jgi:hypothetical protein